MAEKMGLLPGFSARDITLKNFVSSTAVAIGSRASGPKYLMTLPLIGSYR